LELNTFLLITPHYLFAGNWGNGRFGRDFRHRRFFGGFAGLYGLGLGYDLGYGYDLPYSYDSNSCYVLTPYGWQWVCSNY
jgi:hypothetical protein